MPDTESRLWLVAAVALLALVGSAGLVAAQQSSPLAVSVDSTDAAAGGTVTLDVTLTNEGSNESVAPVVTVRDVPESWSVVERTDANGTWRASTNQWLWFSLAAGETVQPQLRLAIPVDASGTYTITVVADSAEHEENVTAETTITVDGSEQQTTTSPSDEPTTTSQDGTTGQDDTPGQDGTTTASRDESPEENGGSGDGDGAGSDLPVPLPAIGVGVVVVLGLALYVVKG